MSGKPAARLSDPTTCPVPGHGTPPIQSGSPNALVNGLPAARLGDLASCGQAISGAYSSTVFINGKNAATVGSTLSHGGVIIGGIGRCTDRRYVRLGTLHHSSTSGDRQVDQLPDSHSRALYRLAMHCPFR